MKNLYTHFSGIVKFNKPDTSFAKGTLLSFLLAACATMFTACNSEESLPNQGNQLQLSFGLKASQSRGLYTDTKLPDNSPVGVKLDGYADYHNLIYTGTTTGGKQTWTSNMDVKIYDTYATLYAYWPYSSTTSIDAINMDMTAADQTDWLYATPVTDINWNKSNVAITMNHAAANINIIINKGTYLGEGNVSQVSIQSASLALKGTFNAAQETPDYTSYEGTGERLTRDITTTVGGSPINIMVLPTGNTAAIGFYVTIDGIEFYTQSVPVLLEKGYSYEYTLTLSDISTYMDITGFTMNPWVEIEKDVLGVYEENDFDADLIVTYDIDESLFPTRSAGVDVYVLNSITQGSSALDMSKITRMQVDGSDIVPANKITFYSPGQHVIKYGLVGHTTIPKYMFYGGSNYISRIVVPQHIESIEQEAFYRVPTNTVIEFYSTEPPAASSYIKEYNSTGLILVPEGCKQAYDTGWTSYVKQRQIILEKGSYILEDGIYYSTDFKTIYFTDGKLTGTVNIKEGVTLIGQSAFAGNKDMTGVVLPESLVTIEDYSFSSGLKGTLTIPNSVQTIGYCAFRYGNIEHVVLGTGLTTIGEYALGDLDELKSVRSLKSTAPGNFRYCWTNKRDGIVIIIVPNGSKSSYPDMGDWLVVEEGGYTLENGIYYSADGKTVLGNDGTLSGAVVIKEGVTTINDWAFYSCKDITSVVLPNSLLTINTYAFYDCGSISEINIPNSLLTIGERAFYKCCNLKKMTFGTNLTSIGYYAFGYCTGLTEITLDAKVTDIEDYAFYNCNALKKITSKAVVAPTITKNTFNYISSNGLLLIPPGCKDAYATWLSNSSYYLGYFKWECYPYDYVVEDGIWYSSDGKTVYKNDGTVSGAVIIKDGVTTISDNAFKSCSKITYLSLPNTVKDIGNYAFYGCSGINGRLVLPESLERIGDYAFTSCTKLTGVLIIPETVTYIGAYAFQNDNKLTETLTIPNSVTSIGNYAFNNCTGFTSLTIGNSVASIGDYAFSGLSNLTDIVLGTGLQSIGNRAFYNISKLKTITSLATTAPVINNGTFYLIKTGGTLTVPNGCTEAYATWMGTGNYYLGYYSWTCQEAAASE